jgi:hypothetical protein
MMDRTARAGVDPDQDSIAEEATSNPTAPVKRSSLEHWWSPPPFVMPQLQNARATGDRDKNSPPPALGHGWIMDGSNQTSS